MRFGMGYRDSDCDKETIGRDLDKNCALPTGVIVVALLERRPSLRSWRPCIGSDKPFVACISSAVESQSPDKDCTAGADPYQSSTAVPSTPSSADSVAPIGTVVGPVVAVVDLCSGYTSIDTFVEYFLSFDSKTFCLRMS